MYDELVKSLRVCGKALEDAVYPDWDFSLYTKAADAIEELQKRVPKRLHGRLIDAEKIYDAVEQRYRMSSGIEHRCERELLDLICAAPTIIEAEEGE